MLLVCSFHVACSLVTGVATENNGTPLAMKKSRSEGQLKPSSWFKSELTNVLPYTGRGMSKSMSRDQLDAMNQAMTQDIDILKRRLKLRYKQAIEQQAIEETQHVVFKGISPPIHCPRLTISAEGIEGLRAVDIRQCADVSIVIPTKCKVVQMSECVRVGLVFPGAIVACELDRWGCHGTVMYTLGSGLWCCRCDGCDITSTGGCHLFKATSPLFIILSWYFINDCQ